MRCQRSSTVLSAAMRRSALSFENTISMGLKSGEYGGRKTSRAARLDGVAYLLALVAAQVVHDDDVAGPQRRGEALLDVGAEDGCVDRPIDHERCCDGIATQCGDEGGGLPVPAGHPADQAFAPPAAAVGAGHVGLGPGLVDED